MALTPKQKIFADEYLIDLNATRAYKVAYPRVRNEETAAAAGARLLRNVKVEDYIQKRMDERAQRTEITQDRVLQELAKIISRNGWMNAHSVPRSPRIACCRS
ncbi:terminase small subunit [Enterocloster bolteae]|uniref:terminase small subunit n=1 Tax=Enterocloster bolteae TaxID=208479 RepID=UPI002A8183B4|nr:terminase small subunit [Enterocloster bolteae]